MLRRGAHAHTDTNPKPHGYAGVHPGTDRHTDANRSDRDTHRGAHQPAPFRHAHRSSFHRHPHPTRTYRHASSTYGNPNANANPHPLRGTSATQPMTITFPLRARCGIIHG